MHVNFEYITSLTSTASEVYKAFRQYLLQTDSTRVRPEFKKKVSKDLYYCLRNKKIEETSAQELDRYNCNFYGEANPPGRHEWLLGTNDYKFAQELRAIMGKEKKDNWQNATHALAEIYTVPFSGPETFKVIEELVIENNVWFPILEAIAKKREESTQAAA